ncbi:MAG: nitroreductase family protein [Nitrososphaerales archaeon]
MDFDMILRKRRMTRSFKDMKVDDLQVMKLLKNAHRAPSAGFLQQQEFIIVKDREIKRKLAEASVGQDFIAQAPVVIVVCANTDRVVKRYGDRGVNFYSIIDGAFSSMLVLLTVVNEGLAACFVGAFEDDKVKEILKLPIHVRAIGIIPVGHANEAPEKFDRISLQKITYFERYGEKKA